MRESIEENDLVKLGSDCGSLKLKTDFCFKNNNKKLGRILYDILISNKKYIVLKIEKKLMNIENSM